MKSARGRPKARPFGGAGPGSALGGTSFGATGAGSSLSYLTEPPSFAAVSDPNVVVAFKNVLKKDSTTKAKALDDLITYVKEHPHEKDGGVEEAVLDIWVQIYPRTSIDNSRRVRELSHLLQYELMKSARKRMERRIPDVVGAWLAGRNERDRVVSRAADTGLVAFLPTPAKMALFWKKCQSQILEFATAAIQETKDSLSDERSTTAEDAEAKYMRVIHASHALVLNLLQHLDEEDVEKSKDKFEEYFEQDNVWKSITFADSSVRRNICSLLQTSLKRKFSWAESIKARQAFITGGLKTKQDGSALQFVIALGWLSQRFPEIWTSSSGKTSPLNRLQTFITKGSQGSSLDYWQYLNNLLAALPKELMTLETSNSLIIALKTGVTNREEPRTNTSWAWECYNETAIHFLSNLSGDEQLIFAKDHFFPLFEQFLFNVSNKPTTIPVGPTAMDIFVGAHTALIQSSDLIADATCQEWRRLGDLLCANVANSLPEVSKDFRTSQDNVAEEGRRWFALVGKIHDKTQSFDNAPDQVTEPSQQVLAQCITLLTNRNTKPYGAAQMLEYALSTSPFLFEAKSACDLLVDFLIALDMEKAFTSPSSEQLQSCLRLLECIPERAQEHDTVWKSWAEHVLSAERASWQYPVLQCLLGTPRGTRLGRDTPALQERIIDTAVATARGDDQGSSLLETAMKNKTLIEETHHKIATRLLDVLEKEPDHTGTTLRALEIAVRGNPRIYSTDHDLQATLMAHLLKLSELSNDDISAKTLAIHSLLGSTISGKAPAVKIVQSNINYASEHSLGIDTLVRQANDALLSDAPIAKIFPDGRLWMQSLEPLFQGLFEEDLEVTHSLCGTLTLIEKQTSDATISRDKGGMSIPARMALYTVQLLAVENWWDKLSTDYQIEVLYLLSLTVLVASDQITTMTRDGLFVTLEDPESLAKTQLLVSSSQKFIHDKVSASKWWSAEETDPVAHVVASAVSLMTQQTVLSTARGVYSSQALSEVFRMTAETFGLPSALEEKIVTPNILRASPETRLHAVAILTGFEQTLQKSKQVGNFCNRLISDVAAAQLEDPTSQWTLTLLTLCARVYEGAQLPVTNTNRIVFAVKQICSWQEQEEKRELELDYGLRLEMGRCLTHLLPCMKDVYGSYWESAIDLYCTLIEPIHGKPTLACLAVAYRLEKELDAVPDPNDDMRSALNGTNPVRYKMLMIVLRQPRGPKSAARGIVDSLLCRQLDKLEPNMLQRVWNLYAILAWDSIDIQAAVFRLLQRAIPEFQERMAVDTMVQNTKAEFELELLGRVREAPTLDSYSDEELAQFPLSLRCYLLSWKLIFDAFATAPFKVRNDYIDQLKERQSLPLLFDFMFDVLGHSAAHPLKLEQAKLSTEHILEYDIRTASGEEPEKNLHWLLIHIYFAALKYTPGLFRSWYMDCRSKQTRLAVEAWTTKYFSPLIVDESLNEVQSWAETQEAPAPDERELIIKVSKPAREVTASYEVDESEAAISIRIPPAFPIENVSVTSVRRVAVNEKKWQSWIMTTQAIITFNNGNIIDGLQVFKRNMVGALKGQGECAICYSVIAQDKSLPDKRCQTCKNTFHRVCLYKWFQTSSQNTCPLCRNPIDYLGSDSQRRQQRV